MTNKPEIQKPSGKNDEKKCCVCNQVLSGSIFGGQGFSDQNGERRYYCSILHYGHDCFAQGKLAGKKELVEQLRQMLIESNHSTSFSIDERAIMSWLKSQLEKEGEKDV